MPHTFDTGLANSQRTTLINGAVSLLAGLARPAGYLNAVMPWGGVIRSFTDDEGLDNLFGDLQGRNPAVAISLGDERYRSAGMGGFNWKSEIDLYAYVLARSPRSITDGRQIIDAAGLADMHADPGLHIIMEHVFELLIGKYVGATATVKQIRPEVTEEVRTSGGFSLWRHRFTVEFTRPINPNRGVVQMLNDIRSSVRTADDASQPPTAPQVVIDNPIPVPP